MSGVFFARFNEAAGIHRRKPGRYLSEVMAALLASMRPPEFTGGNDQAPEARPRIGSALQ